MNYTENNLFIKSFLKKRELSITDVDYLLNPDEQHQHNPQLLYGVDEWIDTLHLVKGQKIAIMPDYDADGVLSGTVARVGLSILGFGDTYLYPPKTSDGYGLSTGIIDKILIEQPDTTVLITTDNGSNAHEGIEYAQSKGLKVLITDHHLAETPTSADAELNPNRKIDTTYPFKLISGTTVIYKGLQAYAMKYDNDALSHINTLIFLVGASTVSDMMPLINENRYYVTQAVEMLKNYIASHTSHRLLSFDDSPQGQYFRGIGLLVDTLTENKKLNYGIDSDTFGFVIGPILNSPRRMVGDSTLGFELFMTKREGILNGFEANVTHELYEMNEERKAYVRKLTQALFKRIEDDSETDILNYTVLNATIGSGIAGLLSGSFTNTFDLPNITFGIPMQEGQDPDDYLGMINPETSHVDTVSGSARSPEWLNLYEVLQKIDEAEPDLILGWGGHEQAAGVSIKAENINKFRLHFMIALQPIIKARFENDERTQNALPIFGEFGLITQSQKQALNVYSKVSDITELDITDVTDINTVSDIWDAVDFFESLEPFGQGFPRPSFSVVLSMSDMKPFFMGADKQHVKLTLPNGLVVIKWNGDGIFKHEGSSPDERMFGVTGELSVNEFRGKKSLQIIADKTEELVLLK